MIGVVIMLNAGSGWTHVVRGSERIISIYILHITNIQLTVVVVYHV